MPKGKKSKVDGAQLRVAVGRPRKHPAQPPPEEEGEGEADVAGPLPDVPAEPLQSSPTPLTAERALTPSPLDSDAFTVPVLRLNAPPPPAKPPYILSQEDVMRRSRLIHEHDNNACSCSKAGAPAPGDADFVEHSFLCQLHWCYAREIGCCELDLIRESNGLEYARNAWCRCLDGAFSRPAEQIWPHERCQIITTDASGTEWPYVPPPLAGYGERRVKCCSFTTGGKGGLGCDCGAPGTYVPMCPFRKCAVTGKRRADRVAEMRGHSLWHDQDRFGPSSFPSPLVSPGWKHCRHAL
jgi:hypothetical protein